MRLDFDARALEQREPDVAQRRVLGLRDMLAKGLEGRSLACAYTIIVPFTTPKDWKNAFIVRLIFQLKALLKLANDNE